MTTMLLTPENIQNQQFHVRFRGFDVDEVDTFLEKVAENYLVLVKENEKLKDELTAVQGEREEVQSQERTFKNAIISAQTIADEMQRKATQEAHVLKENARQEAAALLDKAVAEEAVLREQITSLRQEKQHLKEELHTYLLSHIERLDSNYPDPDRIPTSPPASTKSAAFHPPAAALADIPTSPEATSAASEAPQTSEPREEEQEAVFREVPEEEDLAYLYEKIDLSELNEEGLLESGTGSDESSQEMDDLDLTVPDLDGDMLFTLDDDPLDDNGEPAIAIEPLDDEKERGWK